MSNAAVDTVPKKKSPPEPTVPAEKPRKPLIVQLRGSKEFGVWVEQGAEFDRSTVSVLVERALILYLKSIGFNTPPPKR